MDRRIAHDTVRNVATLIGEIMEDHVGLALAPPVSLDWPVQLRLAGEDITQLAVAIDIIARRAADAGVAP